MSHMYDKKLFAQKLTEIRKKRWEQFKENKTKPTNPFEQYACCRSQETLAEALGVERRTIGKWELGSSIPTIDKVADLCNLLECNIDYLLGAEELIGFSSSLIAHHYSDISIDIINYVKKDGDYLNFLNYFMHPDNCSSFINSATITAWREYYSNSELTDIKEPLKKLVTDIFHNYQSYTPINKYSKKDFNKYLTSALPKSKISFTPKKLDECIYVCSCIPDSKVKELKLSNRNPKSYQVFIDYLADYSFDILTNREIINIQKEHLGQSFVRIFEEYLSE